MQKLRLWHVVAVMLVIVVAFAALLFPTDPGSRIVGVQPTPRNPLTQIGDTYRPEEAAFTVRLKDVEWSYRLASTFVMPGESVDLEVRTPSAETTYAVEAEGGEIERSGRTGWRWRAPDSVGLYRIHIDEQRSRERVTLHAFVMVPYDLNQEELRGYRIGQYRRELYKGDSAYTPPRGFIEVTSENENVLVSPHFTLGQFLCKQESDYPKFVLLEERLLVKLEMLLREINELGFAVSTLHVMSAFRTPYYNRSIGNDTDYSQHLYGGAADVFVDVNRDSYMDDLTEDGDVTREDAELLAGIIEEKVDEAWYRPFVGGLGVYSPAPHRGPFVHVDVRGTMVRW